MKTAKQIATELFNEFTALNMFNMSSNSTIDTGNNTIPASTLQSTNNWIKENNFANLAIQAIGYEDFDKNDNQKEAVYIYVSKGSDNTLRKIEHERDGVQINTRKLSPIIVKPESSLKILNSPNTFIGENMEIACGSSCAPVNVNYAGTIGALIKRTDDDNIYILSNNHVIGNCNHAQRNTIIMSPAHSDASIGLAPREIGRLSFILPLTSGHPDFVQPFNIDAALAKVTNVNNLTSWQGNLNNGYDTPPRILPTKSGMLVKKFGRTTGLTHGKVETCIAGYSKLSFNTEGFNATVYFSDFWFIKNLDNNFALPGDSGSLVVTEDAQAALGLLFAANKQGAFMVPLIPILTALGGKSLVSGFGLSATTRKSG